MAENALRFDHEPDGEEPAAAQAIRRALDLDRGTRGQAPDQPPDGHR